MAESAGSVTSDSVSATAAEPKHVYLVKGDDASLVAQSLGEVVGSLVGDRDSSGVVEEHGLPGADEIDVGAVADALMTPPFIADRRVVVVRDAGRLSAEQAARLSTCFEDPLPGVFAVIAAGGGTVPAALVKAVQRHGAVLDTSVGIGRNRSQWLADRLRHAPVRLDARATALLGEHLGEDMGRLQGLLQTLATVYGPGASVGAGELEPFLGEAGSVPPWELTDAIDSGDTSVALGRVARMTGQGGIHPLGIMAVLHRHYEAMLRLDGSGVTRAEEAAEILGMRSAFPAKKALEQANRLGSARIGRAIVLLSEADLDLRGRSATADRTVIEILVARLSRLGSVRRSGVAAGGRRRR